MRLYRLLFLCSFLCFTTFYACKNTKNDTDTLKIVLTNFDGEIDLKQNLVFSFNKNVVGSADLHKWTNEEILEIRPKVVGQFKWSSTNELTFSPRNIFSSSTNFEVKPTKKLLAFNDSNWKLDNEVIKFNTPFLEIAGLNLYWSRSALKPGEIVLKGNVVLNSEVAPNDLTGFLSFEADGKTLAHELTAQNLGKNIAFELYGVDNLTDDAIVKVNIKKGMALPNNSNGLDRNLTNEKSVPEKDKLSIVSVTPTHDGLQGNIFVATSQEIDQNTIKENLKIVPKINYAIEVGGSGFTIRSADFSLEKSYTITMDKSTQSVIGSSMDEEYQSVFTFGQVEPKVNFTNNKAMYLGADGHRNISAELINVEEANVEIYKIFSNNLQAFFRESRDYGYHYDRDARRSYDYQYYNTEEYGQLIHTEKINTKELKRQGARRLLNIDFKDKIPEHEGVYIVKVTDKDRLYLTDSKIVSMSDIGLICKKEKDRVWVFANSIKTAKSLAGVEVKFISNNNQELYTATTDGDGVAFFDGLSLVAPDFTIGMVTAQKGEDFNMLPFGKTYVNAARFEVGGKYISEEKKYEAFLYGERNIYRPGDTLNIAAIVRDFDGNAPAEMPVKVKVLLPNGKEYKTIRRVLSQQGSTGATISTTPDLPTGTYNIQLLTATDQVLATERVSIEEFIPDRIKVKLELDKKELELEQDKNINVSVSAVNFFGPPAANRKYEVEVQLRSGYFYAKDFSNYNFSNNKRGQLNNMLQDGKTDGEGNAEVKFTIDNNYQNTGLLNGRVFATVFDENGRSVNQAESFKVFTQSIFYGIGWFDSYIGTRKPVQIPLVAVDKDGNALSNESVQVQVIRKEWQTVLEKNNSGYYRYVSQKKEITERTEDIVLNGKTNFYSYTPRLSGSYEIRVYKPGTNVYVSRGFYAYGHGDTETTSFEVDTEGNIEIKADKEKYNVGETATILLNAPFDGKMLITLETDEVVKHFYRETNNKTVEIKHQMSNDEVPTVYVTATLIKPHVNNNLPLLVAHGFEPIEVHNPMNNLEVKINAAPDSRSNTKHNIQVVTDPYAEVTLAIVDEGILQLKNYQTPNPYDFFYQKRALQVASYDLYPYLFPELEGQVGLAGGDGGTGMSKRLNPLASNRVNLVRFWSGVMETDAQGRANLVIDIPQFSGDLRIMAVAFKDKSYGSASHNMKVADPIVLSTAMPRFLSPTDALKIPVTVTNTTDKAAKGSVSIVADGPLGLEGSSTQDINIPPNSEAVVEFVGKASENIGEGAVTVTVNALGESFTEKIRLPVRPATSLQKKSGSGAVVKGNSETVSWASDYVPQSIDGKVLISSSPLVEFARDLDYLVRYPHGCLEQTISKAFPQMYYTDMVRNIYGNNPAASDENPDYNVQVAIDKVSAMQLSNGGLSYWPGRGYHSWWGSVFALHFLYEAQQKGFDVQQSTINNLKGYLQFRLKSKETFMYYYNQSLSKEIASKEIAYSLYVLALMGEPEISTMNYYKGKPDILSLDSKYLLAGAYALAGDQQGYQQIIPSDFSGEKANQANAGSFYSYLRDLAISLNCLVEVRPDDPQIPEMARQLTKQMKGKRYMNTQERVFSFLALGKIAQRNNANTNPTGAVIANGKEVAQFDGSSLTLNYEDIGAQEFVIKSDNGDLYYFWNVEGVNMSNTYEEKDNYLQIRKTLLDRNGKKINASDISQNELIVVKLNLKSKNNRIDNVVITDILPACFEIENPRLGELPPSVSWAKNYSPDFFDIRDDRIMLFTTAYNTTNGRDFYYVCRAVSKGEYVMGPASADAMYDGEYYSYSGGGKVTVKE